MPEAAGTLVDGVAIGGTSPVGARPRRVAPESAAPVRDDAPAPTSAPVAASPNDALWRRAALLFAVGLAALAALYSETIADLWEGWGRSGTFAHGYIIFPVSAWLVWRLRDTLRLIVPKAQPLALLPLVACGVLWVVGRTAGVHATTQYAFVAMIPCLVWGVLGTAVTKRIAYPLAFLFFAVPAGDFLMPTLMDHTADFTVAALRFSGVPVFREGNFFSIPSGNWSVVEACSGLRYLIASITLGFLFAYLNYRSVWRRAAFIVASILVPIVANWLRAYMIVMLAHLSSNKLATGVDHLIYGWLFFGLVMLLLFWVGNFWRDDDEPVASAGSSAPSASVAPSTLPVRRPGARAIAAMAAATIAVAAPWPALGNWFERIAEASHPGAIGVPDVAGWQRTDAPIADFVPHYRHARSTENVSFVSGGREVGLFVGYYAGQASHGPLVTYDNDVVIVGDKVWGAVARRERTVDGGTLKVAETEVRSQTEQGSVRLLAWRWYWINGRLTTSDYVAKAYHAFDKLTGRGDDAAVIVVTTPMTGPDDRNATTTLAAFVAAAEPKITARLAEIRAQARK